MILGYLFITLRVAGRCKFCLCSSSSSERHWCFGMRMSGLLAVFESNSLKFASTDTIGRSPVCSKKLRPVGSCVLPGRVHRLRTRLCCGSAVRSAEILNASMWAWFLLFGYHWRTPINSVHFRHYRAVDFDLCRSGLFAYNCDVNISCRWDAPLITRKRFLHQCFIERGSIESSQNFVKMYR